jgi:hypothetical protein
MISSQSLPWVPLRYVQPAGGFIKPQNYRQNNNLVRLDHFSSEQPAGESSGSNMTRLRGKQDAKTPEARPGPDYSCTALQSLFRSINGTIPTDLTSWPVPAMLAILT